MVSTRACPTWRPASVGLGPVGVAGVGDYTDPANLRS
jgi:hypothetical protein